MKNKGFTLIELIMVIVIIGILAAVAIPKYIDLSQEAQQAATNGFAGALSSASAVNYAACQATGGAGAKCAVIDNCSDVAGLLATPLDTTKYTITAAAITGNGTVKSDCVITDSTYNTTANFTGIGAGQ